MVINIPSRNIGHHILGYGDNIDHHILVGILITIVPIVTVTNLKIRLRLVRFSSKRPCSLPMCLASAKPKT